MPKLTEIRVRLIARTQPTVAMKEWLADVAPGYAPESTDSGSTLIGMAAKRCYMSFVKEGNPNLTKVRTNWAEFFENILASGHGSVLEHSHFSFAIEGLTRVCTAELNRHRAGVAISEGSQRFIRFDECIPYWLPTTIRGDDHRSQKSKEIFEAAFLHAEQCYRELCELHQIDKMCMAGKKRWTSLFRRIVPMGCCTGGVWTFNFRALRHVIALRTQPAAEEEIRIVANLMAQAAVISEPLIFGDFQVDDLKQWTPRFPKV